MVNFGSDAYTTELRGRKYLLPQFGFAVNGPRIDASLAMVDGAAITSIVMDGYRFSDAQGVPVATRRVNRHTLRVNADYAGGEAITFTIRLRDVVLHWDLVTTEVWQCDSKTGERTGQVAWTRVGPDRIRVGPFEDWAVLDLVCAHIESGTAAAHYGGRSAAAMHRWMGRE